MKGITTNLRHIIYIVILSFFSLTALADERSEADLLFDWAEKNFSYLFSPANQSSLEIEGYWARYYPGTDNYVGVKDGMVYVYGEVFGGMQEINTLDNMLEQAGLNKSSDKSDINGSWKGYSVSNLYGSCRTNFDITFKTSDNEISGSGIGDGECTLFPTPGDFVGSFSGNDLSFKMIVSGGIAMEFTGVLSVDGQKISGQYYNPALNDNGNFTFNKVGD